MKVGNFCEEGRKWQSGEMEKPGIMIVNLALLEKPYPVLFSDDIRI
jgi:hypothetical protein